MAKRLTMNTRKGKPFSEVWGEFITSQTAKGVAEITLRNYRQVLHNITRFFDVETPMDELSKSDFEKMVVEMRGADLAHNTIATYLRVIRTFLNWYQREGIVSITIPNIKEKETVKETYSDEELELLLRRPDADCQFCEFRNWTKTI